MKRALLFGAVACLLAGCTIDTGAETSSSTSTTSVTTTTLPPAQQPPKLSTISLNATQLASYPSPLVAVTYRAGSTSLYVADNVGHIYEIKRDVRRNLQAGTVNYGIRPQTTPVLDITREVDPNQGLHGFAFSTDGTSMYVSYTNLSGAVQVDAYTLSGDRVSTSSQEQLLAIPGATGGPVMLGPDGYLYIALGDGGDSSNGQNPKVLPGKILRIDPEGGTPYAIPPGNPRVSQAAKEVYISGVRQPTSMTWVLGQLWITDVGDSEIQEINVVNWKGGQPPRGANLGWDAWNGNEPNGGKARGAIRPLTTYTADGDCHIVGGDVYNGRATPALQGVYLYADSCGGQIRALRANDTDVTDERTFDVAIPGQITGLGQDPQGEPLAITSDGHLYQLVATSQ